MVSVSDLLSVPPIAFSPRKQFASFKIHANIAEIEPPKWWEKNAGPNMKDIHSTQEFLSALSEAGDKLVIVEFYGTWCASCRALFPKKRNAMKAQQIQDMEEPIASKTSTSSFDQDDIELESLPLQSIIKSTNVHYGQRPDLKGFLLDIKESSVEILVSGPKKMKRDVATICSSGQADNLHFESISFTWFSMSSIPAGKYSQAWAKRVNYRNGSSYISRLSSSSIGMANENRSVQEQSMAVPTSVPVRVAHELLLAGHHYLDVRTVEEFSIGHVAGAVNVPFLLRIGPGMTHNPKFLEEVLSHYRKDDEIIVGCQLGKRSLMAATELLSAGFSGVTDMAGGYAAWIQNGLPTES